ncbi:MAG: POTRA domain-containing protein [Pseudomonadota bacterium]
MRALYILIIFLLQITSYSETIKTIKIQGNELLSKQEYIQLLPKTIINTKLSNKKSHEIITKMLKYPFINDIKFKQIKNTLHIHINEAKFIKKIKLPKILQKHTQLNKVLHYNKYLKHHHIAYNAKIIKQALGQIRSQQEITYNIKPLDDKSNNQYILEYTAVSINQLSVRKISFVGNKNIRSRLLIKCTTMIKPEASILGTAATLLPFKITKKLSSSKPPFIESSIPKAIESIKTLYQSEGFFTPKITYTTHINANHTVDIKFFIQENKKYYINKINITNDTEIDIPNKIKNKIKKLEKKICSNENFTKPQNILSSYLHNQGYKHISVNTNTNIQKNHIDLTLKTNIINKNYIQNIVILGNKTIQTSTILQYVSITPGEMVLQSDINQTKINILRSGIVKDVNITIKNNILYIQIAEKETIKQGFSLAPLHWPPVIILKYNDINFDGLNNQININTHIQKNKTTLEYSQDFHKPNSIIKTTISSSFTTNSITQIRFKNWKPYFKSDLYNKISEFTKNDHEKTYNNIHKIIQNQYVLSAKKQINNSWFKEHELANYNFDFYDADGKLSNEEIHGIQTNNALNKYNVALGGKELKKLYKVSPEDKNKLQRMSFSNQINFNFKITDNISCNLTPKIIWTYNSIPRPSKHFKYIVPSLFHNAYLSKTFNMSYNNTSMQVHCPKGINVEAYITPIFEMTKNQSISIKTQLHNNIHIPLSDSIYIRNTTKFGYIFNITNHTIPYDHLFSLNDIVGFVQGGGYDLVSLSPILGNSIMSNVISINKVIPIIKLAPILRQVDIGVFLAAGKLNNNQFNSKKDKFITGNNKLHITTGIQLGLHLMSIPPIYLAFSFDIINPIKHNEDTFDSILPSLGNSFI